MPGAISRTTGSAIRWNSFQPSFMRHGALQPFSVTTGLNGRPSGGAAGGNVLACVMMAASGIAIALARDTRPAPSIVAAPVKKPLRETIVIPFSVQHCRQLSSPCCQMSLRCLRHHAVPCAMQRRPARNPSVHRSMYSRWLPVRAHQPRARIH